MAEGVNVGKLLVTIAADVSDLKKARTEAGRELGALNQAVGAVTRTLGTFGAALSVQQLAQFAIDATRSAAAIGNLADQAGLSVQQFQGLAHALRDAQLPQEQLAQGMAVFARNMSDLQRGTGPFLDFLRQAAPHLIEQFQAATNTAEAFGVLTDATNRLGNQQDRLRLLNAAGADAFGRLANSMRQGRGAIESTASSYQGLTEAETKAAQELQRRWDALWARFTTGAQRAILSVTGELRRMDLSTIEGKEAEIGRLEAILRRGGVAAGSAAATIRRLRLEVAALRDQARDMESSSQGLGLPDDVLRSDAIRKAQGELALYMQRLQGLPAQADFVSESFAAAWEKQLAVLRLTGATEAEISAARIAMLRAEDAERQRVLGGAIQPYEEQERRVRELNHALQEGIITAEQHGRAMVMAAAAGRDAYLSAASAIGQAVSKVFEGNKGVAVAAAIIDTLAAANKALAAPPGPPISYAYVAAALATGFANVRAIMATNKNSTSIPSAGGGGGAPVAPAEMGPSRSLFIQGVDPAALFSGAQVQELIRAINGEVQNGVTLISTKNLPI